MSMKSRQLWALFLVKFTRKIFGNYVRPSRISVNTLILLIIVIFSFDYSDSSQKVFPLFILLFLKKIIMKRISHLIFTVFFCFLINLTSAMWWMKIFNISTHFKGQVMKILKRNIKLSRFLCHFSPIFQREFSYDFLEIND